MVCSPPPPSLYSLRPKAFAAILMRGGGGGGERKIHNSFLALFWSSVRRGTSGGLARHSTARHSAASRLSAAVRGKSGRQPRHPQRRDPGGRQRLPPLRLRAFLSGSRRRPRGPTDGRYHPRRPPGRAAAGTRQIPRRRHRSRTDAGDGSGGLRRSVPRPQCHRSARQTPGPAALRSAAPRSDRKSVV